MAIKKKTSGTSVVAKSKKVSAVKKSKKPLLVKKKVSVKKAIVLKKPIAKKQTPIKKVAVKKSAVKSKTAVKNKKVSVRDFYIYLEENKCYLLSEFSYIISIYEDKINSKDKEQNIFYNPFYVFNVKKL